MTPERWREVERIFHAAVECAAADRNAFLDRACAADDALRREVDSLLTHRDTEGVFLEPPRHSPARPIGRALGPYEVRSLVASGGMGEVYRAVDRRLGLRLKDGTVVVGRPGMAGVHPVCGRTRRATPKSVPM